MKHRKFVFAETAKVDKYQKIAAEFMEKIFEIKPGDYLISDESILSDFSAERTADFQQKIFNIFSVDISAIKHGNLAEIFEQIQVKRNF